jgi:hypothetical protein
MQQNSAQERAFHIPEILETILLQIPLRNLLVDAQRVNNTWHSTIQCSPALQRFLFFEPRPRNESRPPEFNVLLTGAFPPFFNRNSDVEESPKWTQEILSRMDWNGSPTKRDAYSRKEASWRRMLVVQPPVLRIDIFKSWSSMTGMGKVKGRVAVPKGLMMGLLYDLVEEEVHAGTTFQSTDFDLQWRLSSITDETILPESTRLFPQNSEVSYESVTVYFMKLESWINIEREDYEPPDLSGFETEEEQKEATSKAVMSNARPHLVSKARVPIHVEWDEEKSIRRWR